MSKVILHFDGAAEPNPGLATYGAVLDCEGFHNETSGIAGEADTTNNTAEWRGLEEGLLLLKAEMPPGLTHLEIYGDSQLVLNQLTGKWGCHMPHLAAARDRCKTLLVELGLEWTATWVPRDQNAVADRLTEAAWTARTGRPFPAKPEFWKKKSSRK